MIRALPPGGQDALEKALVQMRAGSLVMRTHDPLVHVVSSTDSSGLAMWLLCDTWATSVADRRAAPPGACPTCIQCVGRAWR